MYSIAQRLVLIYNKQCIDPQGSAYFRPSRTHELRITLISIHVQINCPNLSTPHLQITSMKVREFLFLPTIPASSIPLPILILLHFSNHRLQLPSLVIFNLMLATQREHANLQSSNMFISQFCNHLSKLGTKCSCGCLFKVPKPGGYGT